MRSLTAEEIDQLEAQRCTALNWEDVTVADDFEAEYVHRAHFSGNVILGSFKREFTESDGFSRHSGIYNASIHNSIIGDDVLIADIHDHIANYRINPGSYILDVELISTRGESSFGNGVLVAAVNEAGGREVPICDLLTSQLAYLVAMYRYQTDWVERLTAMVDDYADGIASTMGLIGNNVSICHCGQLIDVKVGDEASLNGCKRLRNGSVNSSVDGPTSVGNGVIADDFIISTDAEVSDGAMLERCFVGQGCQVGKGYSATDVLFFANCQAFHGEAASVFAGPYTVTHHRGSLLIAAMYSFMNVGSSSNQSNHAYKLGPNHQGVLERGCKLASGSHLIWPAHLAPYTMVMGHHAKHPDMADFPFSYLMEEGGNCCLVPGAALKSVGTIRDAQKWPARDRRSPVERLDVINFSLLNPFVMQKVMNGLRALRTLRSSKPVNDIFEYDGYRIRYASLLNGIDLYQQLLDKYIGDVLIHYIEKNNIEEIADLQNVLDVLTDDHSAPESWIDLSGLFVTKSRLSEFMSDVMGQEDYSVEQFNDGLNGLNSEYAEDELKWLIAACPETVSADNLCALFEKWYIAVNQFDHQLLNDAKKEFYGATQIGYGMDDKGEMESDYEQVHGNYDNNSFVLKVNAHIEKNRVRYEQIKSMLSADEE